MKGPGKMFGGKVSAHIFTSNAYLVFLIVWGLQEAAKCG